MLPHKHDDHVDMAIKRLRYIRSKYEEKHRTEFKYSDEFYTEYIKKYTDFDMDADSKDDFKKTRLLVSNLIALWIVGAPHNLNYAVNFFHTVISYRAFLLRYPRFIETFIERLEHVQDNLISQKIDKQYNLECVMNRIKYLSNQV